VLRANGLIGWDENLAKSEVPAIFKRRHKTAFWNGVIPVICFGLIGYFGTLDPSLKSYEFYIFFAALFCFLWAYIFLMLSYRCPRCGQIPYSSLSRTGGILLFPKKCCKCKAPLLPDHPWAQE
jgi:hypothetical protein